MLGFHEFSLSSKDNLVSNSELICSSDINKFSGNLYLHMVRDSQLERLNDGDVSFFWILYVISDFFPKTR